MGALLYIRGMARTRQDGLGYLATCIYLAVPRDEVLAGSAVGMEQVPQGSGHSPRLSDIGFGFLSSPVWSEELDSVIHVSPFQLKL